MRKSTAKKLIFLFAALCMLVAFACISVSKFVLTDKKDLVGVYTDFVLSHDGDGQTAVIRSENDSGSYSGYITTMVSNFTEEKVSKRDVRFSLRAPTSSEVAAGKVIDAWGNEHKINPSSKYYDVTIVDENNNTLTSTSDATLLKANARNSSSLLVRITRKATATVEMPDEGTEQVTIVLETSAPYKDLQVFTVNTTTARLSVGVSSDVYNGFDREIVNLKSATDFVRKNTLNEDVSYMAEVTFALSGDVTFDYARYAEMYGKNAVLDHTNGTITIRVRAGADVNLYFYVGSSCSVTVKATIDDGRTATGTEKVSGVGENNIVFAK